MVKIGVKKSYNDSYLSLGVRPSPRKLLRSSQISDLLVELVGQDDSKRHALLGLISGIAEHETLIASADVVLVSVLVHGLSDIRRLLFHGQEHVARSVVEAFRRRVVADVLDGVTNHLLVVDVRFRCDLAAY